MDWHTWIAFCSACVLIAVSPGSGAVLSMSHGLAYGVRRASATIAGLQAGLLVILLIAGGGVGAVLLASGWAFALVKTLGACYLIYLGWRQWGSATGGADMAIAPGQPSHHIPGDLGGSPAHAAALLHHAPPWQQRWVAGFLTNATNPKGIIFMVAVLPQFLHPHRPLWVQLAVMSVTMLGVDTVVMHGYAAGASALRRWMRSPRAARWQSRVFGGLLMVMGLGLFFVQRGTGATQP